MSDPTTERQRAAPPPEPGPPDAAGRTDPGPTSDPSGGPAFDLADRVRRIARDDPHRVALVHATRVPGGRVRYRRHSYRELSDRAEALAVGLRRIGIGEQTLCSFMVPPSLDALVVGLALWRVGAVLVGIEPHGHGLRRVGRCLAEVGPEVFVGPPRAHAARLAFGWGRGTVRTNLVTGRVGLPGMPTLRSLERRTGPAGSAGSTGSTAPVGSDGPAEPGRRAVSPADPAVIAFTTGSTGTPKPTVLRHRNLAAMLAMLHRHWGHRDGREVVDMITFPAFWIIGLSAGGTVVVPPMDFSLRGPGDADPAPLVRTIEECGVRSMFASPALLANLASHARSHRTTLRSVRRIVAGGAEVPGPLFAEVQAVLGPDGEMCSAYGATEALPVTEIAGAEVVAVDGTEGTWAATAQGAGVCVGRPLPGVEVGVVAVADGPIASWADATPLPTGTIGEVVARSPHISEGYHRQPRADADNKITDPAGTWHRLGDVGYLDADGRLWLCGRRSHRVVTDRGVTYPLCCEPVYNAHPAVRRSALVGVDDGTGRQVPTICVELEAGADPARATAELEALTPAADATRLVERVVVVDRLPVDRRHNAKIDRPRLAATLGRGGDGGQPGPGADGPAAAGAA